MDTKNRIFIVDDDPYWTRMLAQILFELGYTNIMTFNNGAECVSNLHTNPALIFLDYQMEDVDGLAVLREIKNHPEIVTIFCTAHEDLRIAMEAMKFGSSEYLLKSNVTVKEVKRLINSIPNRQ